MTTFIEKMQHYCDYDFLSAVEEYAGEEELNTPVQLARVILDYLNVKKEAL